MALFDVKKIQHEKEKERNNDPIIAKINMHRRQLLVHSYLYYELDNPLWTDAKFDEVAHKLKDLVIKYPDKAKKAVFAEEFKEWDSDPKFFSGYCLPYDTLYTRRIADRLLFNKVYKN